MVMLCATQLSHAAAESLKEYLCSRQRATREIYLYNATDTTLKMRIRIGGSVALEKERRALLKAFTPEQSAHEVSLKVDEISQQLLELPPLQALVPEDPNLTEQNEFFYAPANATFEIPAEHNDIRIRVWPEGAQLFADIDKCGNRTETSAENIALSLGAWAPALTADIRGLILTIHPETGKIALVKSTLSIERAREIMLAQQKE